MPPAAAKPSTPIKLPAASSSPESIIDFILESAKKIPGLLSAGNSVTRDAKSQSIGLAKAISDACKLLSERLPNADSTIVEQDSGVIAETIRSEFAKLREELQQQPTPTSYAVAAASQSKRPQVKTPTSRPCHHRGVGSP